MKIRCTHFGYVRVGSVLISFKHLLQMLAHNPHILGLVCFMAFALLMYNIAGMNVTGELGAVFRTVLETTRTLFVWLVRVCLLMKHAHTSLVVYRSTCFCIKCWGCKWASRGASGVGSSWQGALPTSLSKRFQLFRCNRFVVLVSGTVIYSKGDDRDVEKMAAEEIDSVLSATGNVARLPAGAVAVPGSGAAAPVHIVGSAAGKVRHHLGCA